mmetsp:Transcript_39959/g.77735  ORF Transcript_39959/g.77735 Transcript_39959/m.77735 type:complete len:320 (-) Transcript_39959:2196-3155(-)
MRNCDHRRGLELSPERFLDQPVGRTVDGGRRFIEKEDLRLSQQRPREAQELALPDAERLPARTSRGPAGSFLLLAGGGAAEYRVEPSAHRRHLRPEVSGLEGADDLLIAVLAKRVQVEPHSAAEQHRVLRDDAQALPQRRQPHRRDVDAVDGDRASHQPVLLRLAALPLTLLQKLGGEVGGVAGAAGPAAAAAAASAVAVFLLRRRSGGPHQLVPVLVVETGPVLLGGVVGNLHEAQQREQQRGLARAGAPDNADLLPGMDNEVDALEHPGKPLQVPQVVPADLDFPVLGPAAGRAGLYDQRRLAWGACVLRHALNRHH